MRGAKDGLGDSKQVVASRGLWGVLKRLDKRAIQLNSIDCQTLRLVLFEKVKLSHSIVGMTIFVFFRWFGGKRGTFGVGRGKKSGLVDLRFVLLIGISNTQKHFLDQNDSGTITSAVRHPLVLFSP